MVGRDSITFSPKQARILITGPTGVDQTAAIRKLTEHAVNQAKRPPDEIKSYSLEGFLPGNTDVPALLDSEVDDGSVRETWRAAFRALCERVASEDARFAIIAMHASWYRHSRILAPIDLSGLAQLKPKCMVTLIDDLYSMWDRVASGLRKHREKCHTDTYFTLSELCSWRWAEVLVSDLIAEATGIKNYVLSVKHPVVTAYRLLFEPESHRRVYACIPISDTRRSAERRREINRIRERLHKDFTVFDPLALDDKVLAFLLDEKFGFKDWHGPGARSLYGETLEIREASGDRDGRWPAVFSEDPEMAPLCAETPSQTVTVDAGEAAEICRSRFPKAVPANLAEVADSTIDNHIRLRDYRMIADALAAYRPQYLRKAPGGQASEIRFALGLRSHRKFEVIVYHDSEQDGTLKGGPFQQIPRPYCIFNLDEWWSRLTALR